MLNIILLILSFTVLGMSGFALIGVLIPLLKKNTQIIQLIKFAFIMWGVAEMYAVLRFYVFFLFGYMPNVYIDSFFFVATCVALFAAIMASFNLILILTRQSGVSIKEKGKKDYDSFINIAYFIMAGVMTIIIGYTFYQTVPDAYGFYLYQINQYVFMMVLILYVPLIIYALHRCLLII